MIPVVGTPVDRPRTEAARLGSYEILGKLARGGMAELFLAKTHGPEGFEKLVVIKKILPHYAANPKFVKLFLDEARLAAGLDHPHIAHVYDMGTVEGNYFFAMEYVHGKDVRTTMRRTTAAERKFPIEHAVLIARNTAEALHYAHERRRVDGSLLGIVHRDVSPSNILISYDGTVKLVDFGVAKAASNSAKTRTGTLKGKISYMSPEQAKGAPVDRRSDVFALGIVLWEMVTSCRLFRTENDLATIQMIINSKPQPPTELRPECPPELERIIIKALAADPTTRYQSAEELQLDLEEIARDQRMQQSSVGLRAFMHKAFEPEITAWKDAQEQGHTLTDFVMHQQQTAILDLTKPVSDSEIEYVPEDDELEEDDDGNDDSSINESLPEVPVTRPLQPRLGILEAPPLDPEQTVRVAAPTPAAASVIVARLDQMPARPSQQQVPDNSAFPKAPKEWLPVADPVEPVVEPVMRHWRNVKVGAIVILVAIVLVAVVFSGGGTQHAASPPPSPVDDAATRATTPMTVTGPERDAVPVAPQVVAPPDAAPQPPVPSDAGEPPVDAPPPVQQRGASPKGDNKLPPGMQKKPKPDPVKPKGPAPKYDPNSPLPPP